MYPLIPRAASCVHVYQGYGIQRMSMKATVYSGNYRDRTFSAPGISELLKALRRHMLASSTPVLARLMLLTYVTYLPLDAPGLASASKPNFSPYESVKVEKGPASMFKL